jgi:hypothetical protein
MRFSDKHTARDKHLLRLERELIRLNKAQWNAPIIPLEHPYQRGWYKTFQLREDALHHPQLLVFKTILAVVNHLVHSRHPGFVQRNGDAIVLRPLIIEPRRWTKLSWAFSHQRLFAYGQWLVEYIYPWSYYRDRNHIRGFKLISTWWLEEKIHPYMITHQKVDLPEVRSRIAEIEAHFRARLGRERLNRLHGRHAYWRYGPDSPAEQRATVAFVEQHSTHKLET